MLPRARVEELTKVARTVAARVEEGRELAIENRRTAVNILKAKQRLSALNDDQDIAERQAQRRCLGPCARRSCEGV